MTELDEKLDLILQRLPAVDTSTSWTFADIGKYMKVSESTARRMAKQSGFPRARDKQTSEDGTTVTRFVAQEIIDWFERDKLNRAS